jgi:CheY-like chemotaxis protein
MLRKRTAQPTPVKQRILIVDDHPLVRRGLTAVINGEADLIVCAEAAAGRDGLGAIAAARPDLVIADLSLGGGDGLERVREIRSRHAGLRVLVLTMHDAPLYVRRRRLRHQARTDRDAAAGDPQRAARRDPCERGTERAPAAPALRA